MRISVLSFNGALVGRSGARTGVELMLAETSSAYVRRTLLGRAASVLGRRCRRLDVGDVRAS